MRHIGAHGGEVMYFESFSFRGERGFLNCDDKCMCVVNKNCEVLECVFIPFMLTCSMMRFISLLLLGVCDYVVSVVYVVVSWSVCEVVLVPYVDEMVDVTVICVLLFVLHVCMLRECKCAMVTAMLE